MNSRPPSANRAERRRQARCKHNWHTKTWPDGRGYRWCDLCKREEYREQPDREDHP